MIGFYDYTVWLTYLSMLSGTAGIMLCLNGIGHPYIGMFFLMFSGLCDAFDGKVARTKKNRTETMKKFGIQIDSLADLICFGVLPACIGIAMMRSSISYETLMEFRFLKLVKKTNCGCRHSYRYCSFLCTCSFNPSCLLQCNRRRKTGNRRWSKKNLCRTSCNKFCLNFPYYPYPSHLFKCRSYLPLLPLPHHYRIFIHF